MTPNKNSTVAERGTSSERALGPWNMRHERIARAAGSPSGVLAHAARVHQMNAAPADRARTLPSEERTMECDGGVKSTGAANSIAPGSYCPIRKGK